MKKDVVLQPSPRECFNPATVSASPLAYRAPSPNGAVHYPLCADCAVAACCTECCCCICAVFLSLDYLSTTLPPHVLAGHPEDAHVHGSRLLTNALALGALYRKLLGRATEPDAFEDTAAFF